MGILSRPYNAAPDARCFGRPGGAGLSLSCSHFEKKWRNYGMTCPHGVGPKPKEEGLQALSWVHSFIVISPSPRAVWRVNFYKCADDTSHPHWLTWSPVELPDPKFSPSSVIWCIAIRMKRRGWMITPWFNKCAVSDHETDTKAL